MNESFEANDAKLLLKQNTGSDFAFRDAISARLSPPAGSPLTTPELGER